jgi:hypothetical protein
LSLGSQGVALGLLVPALRAEERPTGYAHLSKNAPASCQLAVFVRFSIARRDTISQYGEKKTGLHDRRHKSRANLIML